MSVREGMVELARRTQEEICAALEAFEPGVFREDVWERPGGGGGRSRLLAGGRVFQKAGVNVAEVHGTLTADAAQAMRGGRDGGDLDFFATGVSVVIHPANPMVPTAHCNYRYFARAGGSAWWFGGGADLTPSYLFEEDARHFHGVHKQACDRHDTSFYPRFKRWCDEYFRIAHREECRGVGGIFFDDLADRPPGELLAFVGSCAAAFLPAYLPIVERRMGASYGERERRWQELRRGRYAEFNLVYDRGTLFGLRTGGRAESVLMSLPPTARWEYAVEPDEGSPEARLMEVLRHPRDWVQL
jgi:coproporphyrinogen III oxidase